MNIVKQCSHSHTFSKDSDACGRGNKGPNKYTSNCLRGKQGPPDTQVNIQCKYCCRSHPAKSCPAYGKQCNRCKGWDQFAIIHVHRLHCYSQLAGANVEQ